VGEAREEEVPPPPSLSTGGLPRGGPPVAVRWREGGVRTGGGAGGPLGSPLGGDASRERASLIICMWMAGPLSSNWEFMVIDESQYLTCMSCPVGATISAI
jgi:hypothetical protein